MGVIYVVIDGLGDIPSPFRKETPLSLANTPNMDELSKKSYLGLLNAIDKYVIPGSDTAHLELFGYPWREFYKGRGILEALGAGISLKEGDVAFRANFATFENGVIVDRRAGRISTEIAKKIEPHLNFVFRGREVRFKAVGQHRGVLVVSDSKDVVDGNDPKKEGKKPLLHMKKPDEGEKQFFEDLMQEIHNRLESLEVVKNQEKKPNYLLIRGGSSFYLPPTIKERYGIKAAAVAGGNLYKGVARYLGMDVYEDPSFTGDENTDLSKKGEIAMKKIEEGYDFVFLHVKATDNFGHDGNFEGKMRMVERIDQELIPLVAENSFLVVTGDHSTPCILKRHSSHPCPVIYSSPYACASFLPFDEFNARRGNLGHLRGRELFNLILDEIGKQKKIGS